MKGPSGSFGQLESLDEGTDKAVQLVLQIISDTAATGSPCLKKPAECLAQVSHA